jgi:ribokinase
MQYDVVIIGDLVVDLIVPIERLPLEPERHGWADGIFVEPGGAGNLLIAARRLNLATATIGALGDDDYGSRMLAMLAEEGVDVQHALKCPGRSTVCCMVITDRIGQHVFLGIKDGLGTWPLGPSWPDVIAQTRSLFLDGYTVRDLLGDEDLRTLLALIDRATAPFFFDPGPSAEFIPPERMAQVLAVVDVLLLTEQEAAHLVSGATPEQMAQALLARGPQVVVLKRGAAGCLVATPGEQFALPAFEVEVVDTVGAGDAFAAAFIAGYVRSGSLRDCAALGNAMGALVTTRRGAGRRIPSRADLLAFLAGHPRLQALA